MAQLYVPGPVSIWMQWPGEAPTFLGHSEGKPRIQIRPMYRPVHIDLAGEAPIDMLYNGEDAIIQADLARFNEPVAARAINRAASVVDPLLANNAVGGLRGGNAPGRVGSLMVTESLAPRLLLVFPYAAKIQYGAGGMPAGYRFFQTILDPDSFEPGSSDNIKRHFIWRAIPQLDINESPTELNAPGTTKPAGLASLNDFGQGSLSLYDHNMSALAALFIDCWI